MRVSEMIRQAEPPAHQEGSLSWHIWTAETESRRHVHVFSKNGGEVKIWLDPEVEHVWIKHMNNNEAQKALRVTKSIVTKLRRKWNAVFKGHVFPARKAVADVVFVDRLTRAGFWLTVNDEQFRLSFKNFPEFKGQPESALKFVTASIEHDEEFDEPDEDTVSWPLVDMDMHLGFLRQMK